MSQVLVLSEHDVHRLLPMSACIEVMADALAALGRGEVANPLRSKLWPSVAAGLLGMMPAYRGGSRPLYALKEVCVFPGNPARGLDTHLGAVLLHDGETGELLAMMNAAAITAIRTAAVSAVATRLLARENASVLAIIGKGVQAQSHREAIPLVRPIREIRMCGRGESVEDAVRGADIIVTATSSRTPILRREWIAAGVHINAVGSSVPSSRELAAEVVADAALYVDRRESTLNESGDYLGAGVAESHIRGELGELLLGTATGRRNDAEITLFKSLGLAVEDLAAAAFLYDEARRTGGGVTVEF